VGAHSYWPAVTGVSNDNSLPEGVERIRADNPGLLTLSGTNTYLVGRPAWVIDPGPDDDAHLDRVWRTAQERGGVAGIALTHGHIDHAGGAASLRERSGAPLGAKAPGPAGEGAFREPQVEGLTLDVELGEGDTFGPLEVFETPGHALDHLSFLWDETLFVGDTVLGEGSVFIPPEPHALSNYLDSLRKLQKLELAAICPGHGPVVHDPQAKLVEYIEHRLDRERRLLEALDHGLRSRDELLDYAWSDVPGGLRPAAALTLEAHLQKLAEEGRLPEDVSPAG
jgi:glyoxylase-like metal-dependent hydrolase (beta-lactamase superfamily II)